ncbi:DHH family phosphoesterase [bacterium]|jgi:single-stranded-DNA-specific exonuclease|nr:DHH family phosphoesterase [bacterium]
MLKIKNIDKAAERIKEAVLNNEQIIIYGDGDLDGISSMVIVKESIDNLISILPKEKKELFPTVLAFSPDRKNEGYGLNDKALAFIKSKTSKGLIITLDCGITNFKEVEDAKNSGFSVVIVDHHKAIGGIPEADIVVDPKQPDDDYPFKEYANVGIAFKLSEELLGDRLSPMLRDSFIELTALATISDMMPEIGENEQWINEGLEKIEYSQRPAIRAIFSMLNPMDFGSKRDMVSKINSALNSAVIENHIPKPYLFLIESDFDKAKKTAEELFLESHEKQREIAVMVNDLIEKISMQDNSSVIFEGSYLYEPEYLGAVASRLCNYFNKPVFLYKKGEAFSRGTVRVPKGMDAVRAMESCKELLVMFGGHAPAAGFTVNNDNIFKFEEGLKKYFN